MKYRHEDGTPFSKEEFQQKLKTDKEFNDEFGNKGIDQISELIKQLKENPDSRRLLVSAWNISDLPHQVLPPCHYGFQVYTRWLSRDERMKILSKTQPIQSWEGYMKKDLNALGIPQRAISLMWNQRSVDTFLGLPFNIASYGLLLEIIAEEVNMIPDELIGNLGDIHLYLNHIEQAKEQIGREPFELPKLVIDKFDENNHYIGDMDDISEYNISQFKLEGYQSHPSIKAPLSN
jgi:thymidylate synthase